MNVRVYLLARPQFDLKALSEFLADEQTSWRQTPGATEPEEVVEVAGRLCYMSFGDSQSPKINGEYIRRLIEMGHESVLEHVAWTFLLAGVSRAFTHQLVRHRVGFAFSQLSQQYHDETDADFVEPWDLAKYPEIADQWKQAVTSAREAYRSLAHTLDKVERFPQSELSKKEVWRAKRSIARSVLPNATETKVVVTANARALRHFLKVRGSLPGDVEMRIVAAALLTRLQEEAPSLFSDFSIEHLNDGSPIVHHNEDSRGETGTQAAAAP